MTTRATLSLTHKKLVDLAFRWLMKNGSCGFAFRELHSMATEIPDIIGFGSDNHSVLVECKISQADFWADQKKPARCGGEAWGVGKYRLYCAPKGIISLEQLPSKWGLIEVNEEGKAIARINPLRKAWPESDKWTFEVNKASERAMMYTALRRLELRGRIDEIYDPNFTE
jgi:hypothetical protein